MSAVTPVSQAVQEVIQTDDNPILWKEHIHLARNASRWSRFNRIFAVVFSICVIAFTIHLWFNSNGYPAMQVAIYVVWILQAAVAVQALAAGANTISREHVGQTWDALVLTGISARQILTGKYIAALRASLNTMLMLGLIRLAMLPIFSVGLVKVYSTYVARRTSYAYPYDDAMPEFSLIAWAVLLAVVIAVAFTVLDTMACTAIGLAASAVTKRGMMATIVALSVRFAPVILFAAFMRYELGATYFWRWWGRTEFSLSDAGTSAMMVLALPYMPWTRGDHEAAIPGLLWAGAGLLMLLIGSLFITWSVIRRTGALPHPQAAEAKVAGRAFGKDIGKKIS